MNPSDITALVAAITALVTAVGGIIALFKHVKAPDPHPEAVTVGGQALNSQAQEPIKG